MAVIAVILFLAAHFALLVGVTTPDKFVFDEVHYVPAARQMLASGREAVLGFFFVRVNDLDEACAIAGESPHAEVGGATEVRMLGAFPKP